MPHSVVMPATFPAHQGLILAAKVRWPRAIDGTALCVGAATPDFAYALGPWLAANSHNLAGVVVWALPATVIITALLRWRAARGIFRQLPNLGPLHLRSYQVLGTRRPPLLITAHSAALGVASHVVIDAFTHQYRWGADLAGLNHVLFSVPVNGDVVAARALQYVGHGVGSLLFVVFMVVLDRRRYLEGRYGADVVAVARAERPRRSERIRFWAVVAATTGLGVAAAAAVGWSPLFPAVTGVAAGLLVAGTVWSPPWLPPPTRPNRPTAPARPVAAGVAAGTGAG